MNDNPQNDQAPKDEEGNRDPAEVNFAEPTTAPPTQPEIIPVAPDGTIATIPAESEASILDAGALEDIFAEDAKSVNESAPSTAQPVAEPDQGTNGDNGAVLKNGVVLTEKKGTNGTDSELELSVPWSMSDAENAPRAEESDDELKTKEIVGGVESDEDGDQQHDIGSTDRRFKIMTPPEANKVIASPTRQFDDRPATNPCVYPAAAIIFAGGDMEEKDGETKPEPEENTKSEDTEMAKTKRDDRVALTPEDIAGAQALVDAEATGNAGDPKTVALPFEEIQKQKVQERQSFINSTDDGKRWIMKKRLMTFGAVAVLGMVVIITSYLMVSNLASNQVAEGSGEGTGTMLAAGTGEGTGGEIATGATAVTGDVVLMATATTTPQSVLVVETIPDRMSTATEDFLSAELGYLSGETLGLTEETAGLRTNLDVLSADVVGLDVEVGTVVDAVSELNTRLTPAIDLLNQTSTRIGPLEEAVAELNARLTPIEERVAGLESGLGTIGQRVDTMEAPTYDSGTVPGAPQLSAFQISSLIPEEIRTDYAEFVDLFYLGHEEGLTRCQAMIGGSNRQSMRCLAFVNWSRHLREGRTEMADRVWQNEADIHRRLEERRNTGQ